MIRKPDNLKLVTGTFRPDRAAPGPALPAIDGIPTPPTWMANIEAAKEFRRLAAILASNRLLTEGNREILAQYAALHGRLVEMWTKGLTPSAALLNVYRGFAGALGLTSMKLAAGLTKTANRFANNAKSKKTAR